MFVYSYIYIYIYIYIYLFKVRIAYTVNSVWQLSVSLRCVHQAKSLGDFWNTFYMTLGGPYVVVVNMLDCNIVVSEFKPQLWFFFFYQQGFSDYCLCLYCFFSQRFGRCILRPSSGVSCLSGHRNDSTWEYIFKG